MDTIKPVLTHAEGGAFNNYQRVPGLGACGPFAQTCLLNHSELFIY